MKLKKKAINLCESVGLDSLTKSVKSASGLSFCAFFSAKTHKDSCLLRVIVSEKRSWQNKMGRYLKKGLSLSPIEDPFLVKRAPAVSEFFDQVNREGLRAFSVDVKDLYYSMPQTLLLDVVKDGIDEGGTIGFQNSDGISADDFVSRLSFYLPYMIVKFDGEVFIRKDGMCIGSCLAPALSNLLLARFDRRLEDL